MQSAGYYSQFSQEDNRHTVYDTDSIINGMFFFFIYLLFCVTFKTDLFQFKRKDNQK